MSAEENKALVRRFYEQFDEGNLDVAVKILDTNCVFHFPGGVNVIGPEGYKKYVATFRTAFTDLKHIIKDMIAEGNKMVARFEFPGTHNVEFMGIAPTGKQIMFPGIGIYHIDNGKFVEAWIEYDALGLLQQLGAVPPLGEDS